MDALTTLFRFIIPAYDVIYQTSRFPNLIHKRSFQAELLYRYTPQTLFYSWVFSLVPIIGGFINPAIILLGALHLYKTSKPEQRIELTLLFLVIVSWAFLGLRAFIGHTFLADSVAESIGWETGSPFQIELAFYHLGIALAAFTLLWNKSKHLLFGIIISKSVFLFGAMGVHIYDLIENGNQNAGNIGPGIVYADLVVPLIIIFLFWKLRDAKLEVLQ